MGAEKELETMSFDDDDKFLGDVRLANLYQNFLRASLFNWVKTNVL